MAHELDVAVVAVVAASGLLWSVLSVRRAAAFSSWARSSMATRSSSQTAQCDQSNVVSTAATAKPSVVNKATRRLPSAKASGIIELASIVSTAPAANA
jgi:hypothetical protein